MFVSGSSHVTDHLAKTYSRTGTRAFDVDMMERIYEKPFEVVVCTPDAVPAAHEAGIALGGNLDGCRIGFDLGASDYKVAAVLDGEDGLQR